MDGQCSLDMGRCCYRRRRPGGVSSGRFDRGPPRVFELVLETSALSNNSVMASPSEHVVGVNVDRMRTSPRR